MYSREPPLVTKHALTQIFIKYMYDIVLEISILDINSQNWITGSCLKLWWEMAKTQWMCDQISNILSHGWRAWKNWFFRLTTFLARVIFWSIIFEKRSKMGSNKNFFGVQKSVLSGPSAMQRNFWNMYCIFKLFCRSFKQLQSIQFWELVSKIEISRTISCIYFMKIWVDLGFESSEVSLIWICQMT